MESALAAYALLYLSWMLLRWGPSDRKLVGDLFQIGLALPASWMCWRAACRGATVPSVRRAWRLMAAGVFSFALANVAQLFYEVVLHELPYPSAVDVLYLLMYPLIFAGLVQFPTSRASNAQRIQLVLDAAVMAIGGAIIVWYVELGPTIVHASSQPALQDVFSLLYPVGDLIVIGALAGVLTRGTLRSTALALRVFGAGSLVFITADLIYGYITVKLGQTYSGGDWVDAIWFAGVVLWIVAAKLQRCSDPDEARHLLTSTTVRRRPSWVPYLSVGVGLGLLVYELRGASFYPVLSLLVAALVSAVLVAIRQLAAQRELIAVQRELRDTNRQLEVAHQELQAAHDEFAALATTDALTGLPNHRALIASIDHELERAARYGRPFALAFLDLDHFKPSTTRSVTPSATPRSVSSPSGGVHVTCSIGIAVCPEDGEDRDALLESADRAMYAAKRLGRNQVISASDQATAALAAGATGGREEHALLEAVDALAAMVDARDRYTATHSHEVASLCARIALTLGCDPNQTHLIGLAARLHDIGKVAIADAILDKPTALTEAEWDRIREHPVIGANIAGHIQALRPALPIIRAHHERFDGNGYPDRLAGGGIPLGARIIAVADAYSAMTSNRPYRAGRPRAEALRELRRCSGAQFDPSVIDALVAVLQSREQQYAA